VYSRTAAVQADGSVLWTGQTTLQWPEVLLAQRPRYLETMLARR
jgi:hypothetical protein